MQCIVVYCYKYTCAAYDCFCAPGTHILYINIYITHTHTHTHTHAHMHTHTHTCTHLLQQLQQHSIFPENFNTNVIFCNSSQRLSFECTIDQFILKKIFIIFNVQQTPSITGGLFYGYCNNSTKTTETS